MKVIVAGCDFRPRPHMVSWFAKAFRRLGCEVQVVSSEPDRGEIDDGSVDPQWEAPVRRAGPRDGGRPVASSLGDCDLFVMIDCGNDWAVVNDGRFPYVYVWREGNPEEYPHVGGAANGAPVFCCMVEKGTPWPAGTQFMPFAVDRGLFAGGLPFHERPYAFCYTGRERGGVGATYPGWQQAFGTLNRAVKCVAYIDFVEYQRILRSSLTTCVADSGRYVASRGLEAMACGQVVFWDAPGPDGALARTGLVEGQDYLSCNHRIEGNEYIPVLDMERVAGVVSDHEAWEYISGRAQRSVLGAHTYEHRAWTLAHAAGLALPLTV